MSAERAWLRPALAGLLALVVLAPLFAWAAGAVGYTEPLEVAAEATGAADDATASPSALPGYVVPGADGPLGTLLAALVGTGLTLLVAFGAGRLLNDPKGA
jgi:cobalt/nickel transport protein